MNIVVTGSRGFLGKNLVQTLKNDTAYQVYEIHRETPEVDRAQYLKKADVIFHLAGVNRSDNTEDFFEGNKGLVMRMIDQLEKSHNYPKIILSSTIHADSDTIYSLSKRAGEKLVTAYSQRNNVPCYVYRLPNLFGKWSKPNYNSVIATFCHNVAHGKEINIDDSNKELTLAYVDDVMTEFLNLLKEGKKSGQEYYSLPITYKVTVEKIADRIQSFDESRKNRFIPDMSDAFTKKLYSTYLSYLPESNFSYPLITHADERGSFTEFVKSIAGGQVSVNISKPGISKGNHWHHTKNEKFLVVKGQGLIRFRDIYSKEVIEYPVSEKKLEVVDIPVGYTHSIVNTGAEEMVTIMWANEPFNPNASDTYTLEV